MPKKITVKSQQEIQAAYSDSARRAETSYETEVKKVTDWQSKTASKEADKNWRDGIAEAEKLDSRTKGVNAAGNAKWQDNAVKNGAPRLATGIVDNAAKQAANFQPFAQTLESLTLADKTRDGLLNWEKNSGAVVKALIAKKRAMKGAGA